MGTWLFATLGFALARSSQLVQLRLSTCIGMLGSEQWGKGTDRPTISSRGIPLFLYKHVPYSHLGAGLDLVYVRIYNYHK